MHLNLFSISGIALAFTCMFLLCIILVFGRSKLHYYWALFNVSLIVWGISAFFIGKATDSDNAIFWMKVGHFGVIFISVLFLHVVYLICEIQDRKIPTIAYILGFIFSLFNSTDYFLNKTQFVFNSFYYSKQEGFLYTIFFITWLCIVFYSLLILIKHYRVSKGTRRNQFRYFLLGVFIGFFGGITNFLPHFGIFVYPVGNFTIPIYCLIVTYAIFRYRLLDINLVIKKTAVYSLSAGILSGIFVVMVLSMTRLISNFADIGSFKISLVAAVLIALIFDPLRNRVQRIVDRVFYKKTYDYYSTLQKFSRDLASLFETEKIYKFVGNVIFSTLGLKNIYILSAVPGGNFHVVFEITYEKDEKKGKKQYTGAQEKIRKDKELRNINRDSESVRYLIKTKDILIREEIGRMKEISGEEMPAGLQNDFLPFQGEAIVPVLIDNELDYLIILGEKRSGDVFTSEDINLLNTISNQTAIALKNARLYSEKITTERLASIGMVSATFAHEIRNPLTSIKTFAQLMPEKYADEEFRESFSKIANDEITRIDRLIKDLMSFSSKNVIPPSDVVNLTEVLNKTIDTVKVKLQLEDKDISIEKLFQITPMNIHGDSQKLEQSFMNIIDNGCQAMGEGGRLSVGISQNGQNIDVKIIDTGRGISYTEINKIFDPFFTTRSRGVGLGLAISRKIIEDHGGEVSVESVVSQGTTFTVSLPVYRK